MVHQWVLYISAVFPILLKCFYDVWNCCVAVWYTCIYVITFFHEHVSLVCVSCGCVRIFQGFSVFLRLLCHNVGATFYRFFSLLCHSFGVVHFCRFLNSTKYWMYIFMDGWYTFYMVLDTFEKEMFNILSLCWTVVSLNKHFKPLHATCFIHHLSINKSPFSYLLCTGIWFQWWAKSIDALPHILTSGGVLLDRCPGGQ